YSFRQPSPLTYIHAFLISSIDQVAATVMFVRHVAVMPPTASAAATLAPAAPDGSSIGLPSTDASPTSGTLMSAAVAFGSLVPTAETSSCSFAAGGLSRGLVLALGICASLSPFVVTMRRSAGRPRCPQRDRRGEHRPSLPPARAASPLTSDR